MSTSESDPGQTKTQQTTPAVQSASGSEADGGGTPQALWAHLRHELRTPLNAIIGYSEMLLGDADDQGLADYIADLNQILSAGHQLLEIINDLLDPNQVASNDVVFNLESLVANLHYKVRIPLNSIIIKKKPKRPKPSSAIFLFASATIPDQSKLRCHPKKGLLRPPV